MTMVKQAFQTSNANMHSYADCFLCVDGFVDGQKMCGFLFRNRKYVVHAFSFPYTKHCAFH